MADRKISELVALTTPAAGDYLPIIDISEAAAVSKNKRITIEELLRGAPDGTAAAPSIAFESDGGNGLYLAAADTIGISTNGVSRATISTTAITSALPIALSGSTSGSVTLTPVAVAGTTTITLPATTGTVVTTGDSGTVTSTMIANGTIVDADVNTSAAIAGTKISPDFGSQNVTTTGTSTAASFSPTSSTIPTNGFYLGAANQLNFATNGGTRITLTTAALALTLPFRAASGTAAAPSVSFTSSNGSGFYYTGTTNEIAATTGGVERQRWGANGLHTFNSAAHSGSALSTTAPAKIYSSTGTYTDTATAASGTVTHGPIVALDNPAIAATNTGVTYTNASTLYIDGAPTAGTNVTIANPYALYVNAGVSYFGGNVGIGTTTITNLLHLRSDSSSNVDHLYLQNRNGGANSGARIAFSNGSVDYTDNRYAYIGAINTGALENGNHLVFATNASGVAATERLRIDSSGRLLVGTSSVASTGYTGTNALFQIQKTSDYAAANIIANNNNNIYGSYLTLGKSRGTTTGSFTIVNSGDNLGGISFEGADGSAYRQAALIDCVVDGTPGANDMPGRLVLSVTADGASTPTEALRITNDRVICYNQPAPASFAAAATLTVADLKTGIIQYTGAAATLTLPTGTLTEAGFSGVYTNMTFEWSLINTGSGLATIGAGTNHTIVGLATCSQNNSARFATRRTAANTYVSYRIV